MPKMNPALAPSALPAITASNEARSSEATPNFAFRHNAFFDFPGAPVYKKETSLPKANVEVARAEQKVVTKVGPEGFSETENTAHVGDYIVTAPKGGERYVLTPANFHSKYVQHPENPDAYLATNLVRAVSLDTDTEIEVGWGLQRAKKGGYAVQPVKDEQDIYLIEKDAFAATYRLVPDDKPFSRPLAKPYGHDRNKNVVDPDNKHFLGRTGQGAYSLDSAYPARAAEPAAKIKVEGSAPRRPKEAQRLAMESEKEFFRKQDEQPAKRAKR